MFVHTPFSLADDHVWLDASDADEEGTWRWVTSGRVIDDDAFTDWGPNQPSGSADDDEDCMNFRTTWDQWNDSTCSDEEHFICEYIYSSSASE